MNIVQIEYFYAAMKSGSFSDAGQRLNVTPQAVSKSIACLEGELGAKLFEKAGRKLAPTALAKSIQPYVEDVLDAYRSLNVAAHIFPSSPPEGQTLRLGVSTLHERGDLWALCNISTFIKYIHNNVELETFINTSDGCMAALDNSIIDAALVIGNTGKYESIRIATLHPHVICAPSNQLAELDEITLRNLSICRMARPCDLRNNYINFVAAFERADIPMPKMEDVPQSLEALNGFIDDGGVALVLDSSAIARSKNGHIIKPLSKSCAFKMPLYLTFSTAANTEIIKKLAHHLRKTLREAR